MRNVLLFGATAVLLTFAAADAVAMGGLDLSPEQSPYALLGPRAIPQAPINEGRSAYTGGEHERPGPNQFKHRAAHPQDRPLDAPGR